MEIVLNGEPQGVPDGLTVAGLLEHLGLQTRLVAVECNRELVPRAAHSDHRLCPGDHVEIVTLVGGG